MAVIVTGLEIVGVSALEPAVLIRMVPPAETAFTAWAKVL
jgi:hypothetical protein